MTTTTAKLTELVEAATPGPWTVRHQDVDGDAYTDEMGTGLGLEIDGPPEPMLRGQFAKSADARLAAAAPALARLVVSLAEALTDVAERHTSHPDGECICREHQHARLALAAVEALEL